MKDSLRFLEAMLELGKSLLSSLASTVVGLIIFEQVFMPDFTQRICVLQRMQSVGNINLTIVMR